MAPAFKRRRMFTLPELNVSSRCCARGYEERKMKWMLVVLVNGITPVNTNLVFEKFADCLAAEEQMRKHYADAFDGWDRAAAIAFQRRRDYVRARDLQAKRMLSNLGTCVPHGDGDQQPLAKAQDQPTTTPSQPMTPQGSPTPQPSPRT